jgi:hypothetical protein
MTLDLSDKLIMNYFNKIIEDSQKKESEFFDLPKNKQCVSPLHNPPSHIHIPQGKGYKHVCPDCKNETTIIPHQITL